MAKLCKTLKVTGKVQGVGFRYGCQQQALDSSLTGEARNMPDGSVQVTVCGEQSAVSSFCDWLEQGPPLSEVREVVTLGEPEYQPCSPLTAPERFNIC